MKVLACDICGKHIFEHEAIKLPDGVICKFYFYSERKRKTIKMF